MMGIEITNQPAKKLRKLLIFLSVAALFMVIITIVQDFLHADFNNGSFYFSESLLFTTFWWLFLPGLLFQKFLLQRLKHKPAAYFLSISLPFLLHILTFPALIWFLSGLFMSHQFEYAQTLQFSLSTYLYINVLFYTVPVVAHVITHRNQIVDLTEKSSDRSGTSETMLVTEGRKVIRIETNDVIYFKANAPYVAIQHKTKAYLSNHSLKTLVGMLNQRSFMQIHRSTLINMNEVKSYRSRLNGDYDVTMSNGDELRLSRNYASEFKTRIQGLAWQ